MRVFALLMLAACGGGKAEPNTLLSPHTTLDTIGAPHVAVFVANKSGLHRVWLDNGRADRITDKEDATPIDANTFAMFDGTKLVILRGRETLEVPDLIERSIVVSPDRKRLAVPQKSAIKIVRVADASVTTIAMPPADEYGVTPIVTWAKDGALLVMHAGRRWRVDPASGARTPLDNDIDWKAANLPLETECLAHGLRLERRVTKREQALVLIPLASKASPEELPAIAERTLVTATNHGRGGRLEEPPASLDAKLFTPSCEHFVFTFGDRVYVGSVKTGAYAFVLRGVPVVVAQ